MSCFCEAGSAAPVVVGTKENGGDSHRASLAPMGLPGTFFQQYQHMPCPR
jgi:hypothetical protein